MTTVTLLDEAPMLRPEKNLRTSEFSRYEFVFPVVETGIVARQLAQSAATFFESEQESWKSCAVASIHSKARSQTQMPFSAAPDEFRHLSNEEPGEGALDVCWYVKLEGGMVVRWNPSESEFERGHIVDAFFHVTESMAIRVQRFLGTPLSRLTRMHSIAQKAIDALKQILIGERDSIIVGNEVLAIWRVSTAQRPVQVISTAKGVKSAVSWRSYDYADINQGTLIAPSLKAKELIYCVNGPRQAVTLATAAMMATRAMVRGLSPLDLVALTASHDNSLRAMDCYKLRLVVRNATTKFQRTAREFIQQMVPYRVDSFLLGVSHDNCRLFIKVPSNLISLSPIHNAQEALEVLNGLTVTSGTVVWPRPSITTGQPLPVDSQSEDLQLQLSIVYDPADATVSLGSCPDFFHKALSEARKFYQKKANGADLKMLELISTELFPNTQTGSFCPRKILRRNLLLDSNFSLNHAYEFVAGYKGPFSQSISDQDVAVEDAPRIVEELREKLPKLLRISTLKPRELRLSGFAPLLRSMAAIRLPGVFLEFEARASIANATFAGQLLSRGYRPTSTRRLLICQIREGLSFEIELLHNGSHAAHRISRHSVHAHEPTQRRQFLVSVVRKTLLDPTSPSVRKLVLRAKERLGDPFSSQGSQTVVSEEVFGLDDGTELALARSNSPGSQNESENQFLCRRRVSSFNFVDGAVEKIMEDLRSLMDEVRGPRQKLPVMTAVSRSSLFTPRGFHATVPSQTNLTRSSLRSLTHSGTIPPYDPRSWLPIAQEIRKLCPPVSGQSATLLAELVLVDSDRKGTECWIDQPQLIPTTLVSEFNVASNPVLRRTDPDKKSIRVQLMDEGFSATVSQLHDLGIVVPRVGSLSLRIFAETTEETVSNIFVPSSANVSGTVWNALNSVDEGDWHVEQRRSTDDGKFCLTKQRDTARYGLPSLFLTHTGTARGSCEKDFESIMRFLQVVDEDQPREVRTADTLFKQLREGDLSLFAAYVATEALNVLTKLHRVDPVRLARHLTLHGLNSVEACSDLLSDELSWSCFRRSLTSSFPLDVASAVIGDEPSALLPLVSRSARMSNAKTSYRFTNDDFQVVNWTFIAETNEVECCLLEETTKCVPSPLWYRDGESVPPQATLTVLEDYHRTVQLKSPRELARYQGKPLFHQQRFVGFIGAEGLLRRARRR